MIEGVEGLAEQGWPERQLLRHIVREMGGRVGLDCYVIQPGRVTVGDPVELLAADSKLLV